MSSAEVSRLIKQEMLNASYPELYLSPQNRALKRVAPKSERKIKLEIKGEVKKETKGKKRRGNIAEYEDEVEFVRRFHPRRPYQWKGRRVNRVLRPGTVVSFTPGERTSTKAIKREYDEVYADEDILAQAESREGEFAYGKRAPPALLLDTANRTPSLKPVTPQVVAPVGGVKRVGDLLPTVQVMVPTKRAKKEPKVENMILDTSTAVQADAGPSSSEMEVQTDPHPIEAIQVRPVKQVTRDIGVQTVDVTVPVSTGVQTRWSGRVSRRRPRTRIPTGVRYHPSIDISAPPVKRTRRRRRRTAASSTRRRRRVTLPAARAPPATHNRKGQKLPSVIYHPSLQP